MNKIKNMAKTQIQHDQQIHLLYKIKRFLLTRMIALQTPSFQILCKSICSRFQTSIAYHTTRTIKKKKKTSLESSSPKKKNKNKPPLTSSSGVIQCSDEKYPYETKKIKKSINDSKNQ